MSSGSGLISTGIGSNSTSKVVKWEKNKGFIRLCLPCMTIPFSSGPGPNVSKPKFLTPMKTQNCKLWLTKKTHISLADSRTSLNNTSADTTTSGSWNIRLTPRPHLRKLQFFRSSFPPPHPTIFSSLIELWPVNLIQSTFSRLPEDCCSIQQHETKCRSYV